jgi:hypothetical protein
MIKRRSKYQWYGKQVTIEFGVCEVKENKQKPLHWYNYECSLNNPPGKALISAIKVTTETTRAFVLGNQHGIAINKLLNGGWPDYPHYSLPLKSFKSGEVGLTYFDIDEYKNYIDQRDNWKMETHPKGYKKFLIIII